MPCIWQRIHSTRFDDITARQPRVIRCVDESLLWDSCIENSFWYRFDYLKLCGENGIIFNKEKFVLAQNSLVFAGFEVTSEGYKPLRKMIEAIQNFPIPRKKMDVRSWFGLTFVPNRPTYLMTGQKTELDSTQTLQVSSPTPPCLRKRTLEVSICRITIYNRQWDQIRAYRRRSVGGYDAECFWWAPRTSPLSLTRLFNDQELSTVENPRILKLKGKTLMYCYEIIHIPGKSNIMKIADITSRNPTRPDPLGEDENKTAVTTFARFQGNGTHAISWQEVKEHTSRHRIYFVSKVHRWRLSWPQKQDSTGHPRRRCVSLKH